MRSPTPAFALFVLLSMYLQGCVTTYQPMAFDYMPVISDWNGIDDPALHMAMDYDVLTEPGMKSYAAMERKNKVNLVCVVIHNTGQKDFLVSRDVLFQSDHGDPITPMSLETALTSLVEPETDKRKDRAVEVEAPASWNILWGAGKAATTAKTMVSHVRFVNDMSEHYLADSLLAPGTMTRGLLVLPIAKGSAVTMTMR